MNKRHRGRGRKSNNNTNPNRSLDSNGPDVKIRGSANTIYDKYTTLARDAASSGHRVKAENYLQHAEHYLRLLMEQQAKAEAQAEQRQQQQQQQQQQKAGDDDKDETAASDDNQSNGKSRRYPSRRRSQQDTGSGEGKEAKNADVKPEESAADVKAEVADKPKPRRKKKAAPVEENVPAEAVESAAE